MREPGACHLEKLAFVGPASQSLSCADGSRLGLPSRRQSIAGNWMGEQGRTATSPALLTTVFTIMSRSMWRS
jgi:hypothetical protein